MAPSLPKPGSLQNPNRPFVFSDVQSDRRNAGPGVGGAIAAYRAPKRVFPRRHSAPAPAESAEWGG